LFVPPPADWSAERRLDYVEFCSKVVNGLRGTDTVLERLFDEAADVVREANRCRLDPVNF
jgi:hypothetical protein